MVSCEPMSGLYIRREVGGKMTRKLARGVRSWESETMGTDKAQGRM